MSNIATAFDACAPHYDYDFTESPLGRLLRRLVWQHLDQAVVPGCRVLELGCGTGEDAVWMARRGAQVNAMDISTAMVKHAKAKTTRLGLAEQISVYSVDITHMQNLNIPGHGPGAYDLIFSNFGALNCVDNVERVITETATLLRPKGTAVLIIMGRWCMWEWLYFGLRLQLRLAGRRVSGQALANAGDGGRIPVRYYSPGKVAASVRHIFETVAVRGIGCLSPLAWGPSRSHTVSQHAFDRMCRMELRLSGFRVAAALSDHFLIELRKR